MAHICVRELWSMYMNQQNDKKMERESVQTEKHELESIYFFLQGVWLRIDLCYTLTVW